MRERITYILPKGTGIDPSTIHFDDKTFNFTARRHAWVEKRYTWGLSELESKYASAIDDAHELHIRWTRLAAYEHASPLVSRIAAGLHVFFTPRDNERQTMICSLLRKLFSIRGKCLGPSKSFSKPAILSGRFANTATYQYYRSPDGIAPSPHWASMICPADTSDPRWHQCQQQAKTLTEAAELHLDFDAISNTVTLTAIWAPNDLSRAGSPQDTALDAQLLVNGRLEFGILSPEQSDEAEEIKLGGFLLEMGDKDTPSPTLFSFPSRHHPLPDKDETHFSFFLPQPTGLHPELVISFANLATKPPSDTCALHAYFTLPSAVFFDRYQLSEHALLESKNLRSLRALSGADDLEAPDWTMEQWGSAALFELAHPPNEQTADIGEWQIRIPFHLRYLQQPQPQQDNSSETSHQALSMPWPVVFWACEAEEGLKMSTNPFDRTNLGYDGLFGPKTMFYHIPPVAGSALSSVIRVPVLSADIGIWLQTATLLTVSIGLAWILMSLFYPSLSAPSKRKHQKRE